MEVMMKHVCKFCNKSFPCGRSLGGHMRSHMINSTDGISKKKLPPISNDMDSANYVLRENPKKSSKFSDDENKVCKECGKSFHSWKALFGHMKCHSSDSLEEEDSWDSISESETEVAVPNKKKRSLRKMKRYIAATTSSSLTLVNNASPCVSEIEQELQEEVAMSLILLSRDMGNWDAQNHEFSDNNSHLLSSTKCKDHVDLVKVKKVKNFVGVPTNGQKREVPSENFGGDDKNKKIKMENENRVVEESEVEKKLKFECTTCYKSFNSYQALGGHRVSHKKTEIGHMKNIKNRRDESGINEGNSGSKKIKMHECPICLKIFSSGQALGGHKRSHLIAEAKTNNNQSLEIQKPIPEIRNFLDLNLPAPVEEDKDSSSEHVGFQKWWMESSHKHEQLLHL